MWKSGAANVTASDERSSGDAAMLCAIARAVPIGGRNRAARAPARRRGRAGKSARARGVATADEKRLTLDANRLTVARRSRVCGRPPRAPDFGDGLQTRDGDALSRGRLMVANASAIRSAARGRAYIRRT